MDFRARAGAGAGAIILTTGSWSRTRAKMELLHNTADLWGGTLEAHGHLLHQSKLGFLVVVVVGGPELDAGIRGGPGLLDRCHTPDREEK